MIGYKQIAQAMGWFMAGVVVCAVSPSADWDQETAWELLPTPPTISPEMRLLQLNFGLPAAIENLWQHPVAKKELSLRQQQQVQLENALKRYRREIGLAIEHNNKLWKQVGGDQSLESANQSALMEFQKQLRNELVAILDPDQLRQFDRLWFTASCDWIGSIRVALDAPLLNLWANVAAEDREQFEKRHIELRAKYADALHKLRDEYRNKWLDELPKTLRQSINERLAVPSPFAEPHPSF